MPTQGCFTCGALLDGTCGKDAQGRWLCGPCWNKRSAIEAKLTLHTKAKDDLADVAWWRTVLEVLLSLMGWGRRW